MNGGPDRNHTILLLITLIDDVISARERLDTQDTQTARRDVVRASFAAIEGMVWLAREHVRDSLESVDALTPLADLALRETTYIITENGKLHEQARSVPLPTAIRLTVAQAEIISPELSVNFSTEGWGNLRRAVEIRNRIMHPRPAAGLEITDNDLSVMASGLQWLIATTDYVMSSTNLVLVRYRDLLDRLLAGDAEALADYHAALEKEK